MLSQMRGMPVEVIVFIEEIKDDEKTGFLTRVGFLVSDDDKYVYLGDEDNNIFAAISHSKIVSIEVYNGEEPEDHTIPEGSNLN